MSGNKIDENFLNFVIQKKIKVKKNFVEKNEDFDIENVEGEQGEDLKLVNKKVKEIAKIEKENKKRLKDTNGKMAEMDIEKNENNLNDGSLKALLSRMTGTVVNKIVNVPKEEDENSYQEEYDESQSEDENVGENYNHYTRNMYNGEDPLTDSSNEEEFEDDEEEFEDEEEDIKNIKNNKNETKSSEKKKIECEVFVENIPYYKDEKQIIKFFKHLDKTNIPVIKVLTNKETGKLSGKAFLKFYSLEDAQSYLNKNVYMDDNQIYFSMANKNPNGVHPENYGDKFSNKNDKFNSYNKFENKYENKFKNNYNDSNSFNTKNKFNPTTQLANNNSHTAFITNLPLKLDENTLTKHFKKFGKINNIRLMKNTEGKLKGFGYVDFENENCLTKAIDNSKTLQIEGKDIVIERAKSSFSEEVYEVSKRLGKKKLRAEQNKKKEQKKINNKEE